MTAGRRGIAIVLLAAVQAGDDAAAAEELRVDGEITSILVRDVDGDRRADICAPYHAGGQRFIAVFRGGAGRSRDPDHVVPVDREAVLWAVADLSPEPGLEILLIAPQSGVIYPAPWGAGGKGPEKVFETDLFFAVPSRTAIPAWSGAGMDIDGDGRADLCLPERQGLRVLLAGGPAGAPWRECRLPLVPRLLEGTRDERLRRAIEDLVREGREGPLVDVPAGFPYPLLIDLDADGLLDLVARTADDRLDMFLQRRAEGFGAEADVTIAVPWAKEASGLRFVDLDGDRRPDAVATVVLLADLATEMRIFIGDPAAPGRGFAQPRQAIRIRGFARGPDLADATGDGVADLLVSSFRLDLLERPGAREAEDVEITHEVWAGLPGGSFARRPAFARKLSLRTRAIEGGNRRPFIHAGRDLTGDGVPDILFLDDRGSLRLDRGIPGAAPRYEEDAAFARKIEDPLAVEIADVDGRPGDEAILRYERRLEVHGGSR